jgi:hypothetical protein
LVPSLLLVLFAPPASTLVAPLLAVPSLPAGVGFVATLTVPERVPLLPPDEVVAATPVSELAPWLPPLEKVGTSLNLLDLADRESSDPHPAPGSTSAR